MGVRNLPNISETLIKLGKSPDTPAAVVERATFESQKVAVGTLSNIAEKASHLSPPATIVIGELATLSHDLAWFKTEEARDEIDVQHQLLAI
jgi:siroheme synthase